MFLYRFFMSGGDPLNQTASIWDGGGFWVGSNYLRRSLLSNYALVKVSPPIDQWPGSTVLFFIVYLLFGCSWYSLGTLKFKVAIPDRPFHNLRASRSGDLRTLNCFRIVVGPIWKQWKGRSGVKYLWQFGEKEINRGGLTTYSSSLPGFLGSCQHIEIGRLSFLCFPSIRKTILLYNKKEFYGRRPRSVSCIENTYGWIHRAKFMWKVMLRLIRLVSRVYRQVSHATAGNLSHDLP